MRRHRPTPGRGEAEPAAGHRTGRQTANGPRGPDMHGYADRPGKPPRSRSRGGARAAQRRRRDHPRRAREPRDVAGALRDTEGGRGPAHRVRRARRPVPGPFARGERATRGRPAARGARVAPPRCRARFRARDRAGDARARCRRASRRPRSAPRGRRTPAASHPGRRCPAACGAGAPSIPQRPPGAGCGVPTVGTSAGSPRGRAPPPRLRPTSRPRRAPGSPRPPARTRARAAPCGSRRDRRRPRSSNASAAFGTATAASSTRAPAVLRILRRSACAQTPPKLPVAAPTTAAGRPRSALSGKGRDAQSIAFLSWPGTDALYSGVANSSASASAIASRRRRTGSGAGSTSRSASYGGISRSPSHTTSSTPSGAASAAALRRFVL